jgi:hypothetical protein
LCILEWPAKAVFGWVWPSLPCIEIEDDVADDIERLEGCNWMGSAQVSVMRWVRRSGKDSAPIARDLLPGLLIRSSRNAYTWLMLGKQEGKRDKVYEIAESGSVITGDDGDDYDVVHKNWIDFQRAMWTRIEEAASKKENGRTIPFYRGVSLTGPQRPTRIPGRAWVQCWSKRG